MERIESKYHHLVPRTYMSAWANESGTMKVEFIKEPNVIHERNKERIAGVNDFYSIRAGMNICTDEDLKIIFEPVLEYTVEYNEKILNDCKDLNKYFYDFENWIIKRKDGSLVSKKHILHQIKQIKIKDIEKDWNLKYEDKWNTVVEQIEVNMLRHSNGSIDAFERMYLMKFFVAMDWRGFCSNEEFEKQMKVFSDALLGEIEIPENERYLPTLRTAADETRHQLLLKFYRKYLSEQGVIYESVMANLRNTNFHFLIADGPTKFITCDSPAFVYKRADGLKEGVFPITPAVLMVQGRCQNTSDQKHYMISHITEDAVNRYNTVIKNNAQEFVIYSNNDKYEY